MGCRGKVREREEARHLRAQGMTMPDIAERLGVSRSSVSLWTRDIEVEITRRNPVWRDRTHPWRARREAEIERLKGEARERFGAMDERDFFVAGVALYAGEGAKTDGAVRFANSDPRMILFFCTWLRRFFQIDESRLRLCLYLHEGLDLDAANEFWSNLTDMPMSQFVKPYRAVPDPSIRHAKHLMGCPSVRYNCSHTHREIMGLVQALLSSRAFPG